MHITAIIFTRIETKADLLHINFLFSIASLDSSTEKNISDVTSDDNLIVRPEYPEQKRILINVQTKIRGDCPIFLNLSSDRPSHKVSQTKAKMSDDQTEYQNP